MLRLAIFSGAMSAQPLLQLDLPGIKKIKSGKVREIFDLGNAFLLVASDRISAYDHVLSPGIPGKGVVLTQLSLWWFAQLADLVPNPVVSTAVPGTPGMWVTVPSRSRTTHPWGPSVVMTALALPTVSP